MKYHVDFIKKLSSHFKGLSMWAREYLNVVVLFVNDIIILAITKNNITFII